MMAIQFTAHQTGKKHQEYMISYFLKKRVYDTVTHRGGTIEGTSNYLIFLVHFLNTGKGRGHDREKKQLH